MGLLCTLQRAFSPPLPLPFVSLLSALPSPLSLLLVYERAAEKKDQKNRNPCRQINHPRAVAMSAPKERSTPATTTANSGPSV